MVLNNFEKSTISPEAGSREPEGILIGDCFAGTPQAF